MKTNAKRIILDGAMAALLLLMYRKLAVSMEFHEIGGLVVCSMFIFHNLLNRKWIAGITRRLFGRKLMVRVRLGYVLDVLLLATMSCIALSGVMISKTILLGMSGDVAFWRPVHYFAAAMALVLVGVHIGLHWSFIRTTFAKLVRLPRLMARPVAAVCLVVVLAFGVYGIATTSFTGWLTDPFTGEVTDGGGQHRGQGGGDGSVDAGPLETLGVIATFGSIVAVPAAFMAATEAALKRRGKRGRPVLVALPA